MFKRHKVGMSFRIFRNSARKNEILVRRPMEPILSNTGELEPLCEGLSQDNLENVSIFRGDVNMLRAEKGEDAIELAVAMKYLKAARYNATKALDIYRNYQKSRESYHLDNLKVHREPLCSEIGSRKIEIVGTYDSEGAPLLVFTATKTKHSDSKAAMQLLFYTLDQAAESEHSQETGIVFLFDLRDAPHSCTSYLHSVLSVLRDGYPLFVKSFYFIDASPGIRKTSGIARFLRQEGSKVHQISYSELSSHFDHSQLPLTLGGTFTPGREPTYPFCSLKTTRPMAQRNRIQRSEGSGPTVTSLAQMFEKPSGESASAVESRKSPPSHTKPLPPTPQRLKPTGIQPILPQSPSQPAKKRSYHGNPQSNGNQPAPLSKPGVLKSLSTEAPLSNEDTGKVKGPPKPPSDRRPSSGNSKKPLCTRNSEPDVLSGVEAPNESTKTTGVQNQIKNWNQTIESKASEVSKPAVAVSVADGHKGFRKRDSDELLTASWSPNTQRPRGRAGSTGRVAKPLVPVQVRSNNPREADSHSSSGTKQPLLPRPTHGGKSKKVCASDYENFDQAPAPRKTSRSFDRDLGGSSYENIEVGPTQNPRIPQHTNGHDVVPVHYGKPGNSPHHGPSQSYENVTMATPTVPSPTDNNPPPSAAPPAPPPEYAVVGKKSNFAPTQKVSAEYDFVDFTPKHKPGEDGYASDDDTLFGKEGPPGQNVIYENFGPDKGNRLMTIEELERHIESKGAGGLAEEYLKIKNESLKGPYSSCRLKCNLSKNRYKDVVCYEETRVKLKPVKGVEGSDYIHANYVSGYNKPEAFILTQGPKDKTVCDFWRMVWEKQVHLIVMVTRCVEMMKRKCAQYWPESTGTVMKHGSVTVEVTHVQQMDGFEQRTLKVSSKDTERTVTHFQFVAWPDYGVPSDGSSVLRLLFATREAQAKIVAMHRRDFKQPHGPPILVHCSAGVGRSGAFCALDSAIDELAEKKRVNLQGIVRKIRLQRAYAIQTEEQYEFCYRTLLEYAKSNR